ncbi:MAG: DUF4384 domain-containing protein [Gammaproteobacteria bacterium]
MSKFFFYDTENCTKIVFSTTTWLAVGIVVLALIKAPAAAAEDSNHRINIEITTHLGDKQTFEAGDQISFLVTLDRDAYLLMIYEDARHNLVQVIPNRHHNNNFYKNGLFIAVPDRDDPFRFVVNPPFGQETLWVFASSKPLPTLAGTTLANGLKKLTQPLATIKTRLRTDTSPSSFGEAKTTIFTKPGS